MPPKESKAYSLAHLEDVVKPSIKIHIVDSQNKATLGAKPADFADYIPLMDSLDQKSRQTVGIPKASFLKAAPSDLHQGNDKHSQVISGQKVIQSQINKPKRTTNRKQQQ